MDRRAFLRVGSWSLAGVAGVGAYAGLVEPRWPNRTRHRLSEAGGRVVQLSDLHFGGLEAIHEEIARRVAGEQPDLVVLTGDTVDDPDDLDSLSAFLELLPHGVPVVAIPGNWEYWGGVRIDELARVLSAGGGLLLVNEHTVVDLGGRRWLVVGVDDLVAGAPDLDAALGGAPPGLPRLLLAHCPGYRDFLTPGSPTFELVLSGHTHGGQVDVLGLRPTPPGSGRYVEGWYRNGGPPMYVSRGLGTSVVPFRLGARPEMATFRI